MLKYHIQTIEVGAAGAADITFNNIPQNYDDLLLVMSLDGNRTPQVGDNVSMAFNSSTTGFTSRYLYGSGTSRAAATDAANTLVGAIGGAVTANTFSNASLFIPNYALLDNKGWSLHAIVENNSAEAYQVIQSGVWANTAAISRITLTPQFSSLITQYSSASLYGIKHGTSGEVEVASGGEISYSGGYTIHTFESSGTFVANRNLDVEYLVVAGGGGGGGGLGGGGGAGGYRSSVSGESSGGGASAESTLSLTASTSYTVIVGGGGAGSTIDGVNGNAGSSSGFSTITSSGGGYGGDNSAQGGSGGSGGGNGAPGSLPAGTTGQGYEGGDATNSAPNYGSGGGGGSGSAGVSGTSTTGGNGGNGVTSAITGTSIARAGGGGGAVFQNGSGIGIGQAGGGNGGNYINTAPTSATTNSGSGGGGHAQSGGAGNGGSGVVIIRYLTP